METAIVDWNYPTQIWFGAGRISELAAACELCGIRRPLLVTDEALVRLPIVASVKSVLEAGSLPVTLFSDVQGNPTGGNVYAGVEAYCDANCDGVIAMGGGSALDAAKSIALVARQSVDLWAFEDSENGWERADAAKIAPVIAIPTTAGTGSEVGRAAVIVDEQAHRKKIIFHPKMLPELVVSDPELSVGLPPTITAWTGIDAFVHALEAYTSPMYHPMGAGIAIEAMRMVKEYLPRAVKDGADLEARGQMLVAASMGATAFQKGLGSIHAVSHVVGALYNTHHGLTNAIVMPYGVKLNASVLDEKLAYLCRALSLPGESADHFNDFLTEFCAGFDIPASLAEIGVDAARASEIGNLALEDPTAASNARQLSAQDYSRLFLAAQAGDASILDLTAMP
ncbi:MAG: iron-containing alcohol dehydrogenase [Pseudomonadota bacterium]